MKLSYAHLVSQIEKKLQPHFSDRILCHQYAGWLVQSITALSEIELITAEFVEWTPIYQNELEHALDKLITKHMPLAYLLGSLPFAGLEILIHPPILIPRAETEEWVCNLIDTLSPYKNEPLTILDLCTGSGCIGLAFADAFANSCVYATDISPDALKLAALNAQHNQISNITFIESDLFAELPSLLFDLIIANPPYIPQADWNSLEPSVKNWEDKNALIAADQGMALIKKIVDYAPQYLNPNELLEKNNIPQLSIEIDATQGAALSTYLKNHGYTHVTITQDLEGKDRVISGRIKDVATAPPAR